jgi:hypothetical protein
MGDYKRSSSTARPTLPARSSSPSLSSSNNNNVSSGYQRSHSRSPPPQQQQHQQPAHHYTNGYIHSNNSNHYDDDDDDLHGYATMPLPRSSQQQQQQQMDDQYEVVPAPTPAPSTLNAAAAAPPVDESTITVDDPRSLNGIMSTLQRLRHIYRQMRGPVRDARAHRRRWQYASIFATSIVGLTILKLSLPPPAIITTPTVSSSLSTSPTAAVAATV